MNHPRNGFHRFRKGIVAVFVAVSLTALLGVVAISVDGGLVYLHLRKARATADAAAMASACELFSNYPKDAGLDPTHAARDAALEVAASNGYTNDTTNSTVTINIPPSTGTYMGKAGYIEVTVTYRVQRGFSNLWGPDRIPVRARAVARGAWVDTGAGLVALDYPDLATLNSQGNDASTEFTGRVIVNSSNPKAVVKGGAGRTIAPRFEITGGVALSGDTANLETTPTPSQIFTGHHPTPDPLAYLTRPDWPPDGKMTTTDLGMGRKRYTLTPGRYDDLPTFDAGDEVILLQASANGNGGIFYIDGGGFKSEGASITMDPNTSGGVMIYNRPSSTSSWHQLRIIGNSDSRVLLRPLSAGPYAGILLWQRRSSTLEMRIEGNGEFNLPGTFYVRGANLRVNGHAVGTSGFYYNDAGTQITGASRIGSQFLVKSLSLGGNGNVHVLTTSPDVARTRIIALVE